MSEPDALLGVVEPQLPDMPLDRDPSAYNDAMSRVQIALAMTQQRLAELRKQREEINAEIKLLVSEEELLERMTRVQRK